MERIEYLGRQLPLLGRYDTVVVGGGAAGAAAGIRCAIDGQKVLLVEKGAFLGGTASRALVCPMMPTYVEHLDVLHRVEETLNRHGVTTRDGITTMIWFAPDQLSDAFEELYVSNGGRLLYDATLVDAVCEDKRIRYIVVMTVTGLQAIAAGNFVDATGDAVLTRMAGVPTSSGDENGDNQVSSLRFIMGGIDVEEYREYVLSLHDEFSPLKTGYFFESAMVAGRNFKLEPIFREGVAEGLLTEEDLRYSVMRWRRK